MKTWIFFAMLSHLAIMIRVADKLWTEHTDVGVAAAATLTIFTAVPFIYFTGWILLPAYGIGAP